LLLIAGGQNISSSTTLPFLNPVKVITQVIIIMASVMSNMRKVKGLKDIL